MHAFRFGLFRFRSPLLTESLFIFSSSGYLDVSVHRVPLHSLCIGLWMTEVCSAGFPQSEIHGSKDMCSSPRLIAACHVFHRLLVPRHPPYALIRMTNKLRERVTLNPTSWKACFPKKGGLMRNTLAKPIHRVNRRFTR